TRRGAHRAACLLIASASAFPHAPHTRRAAWLQRASSLTCAAPMSAKRLQKKTVSGCRQEGKSAYCAPGQKSPSVVCELPATTPARWA
ncbi:hypothetical protein K438DRAFT_1881207, partial [Mycena galopus ATCC 62051]